MPAPAVRLRPRRQRASHVRATRKPQRVAEWVMRSLAGEEPRERRVLLWLSDRQLRHDAAARLRERGYEVVTAEGPSVSLLGQRFAAVVVDVAVERSLELGRTMQRADYADRVVFATSDAVLAETMQGLSFGEVAIVQAASDLVGVIEG